MRDPARIAHFLERLRRVWQANPDLRLGQMVANAAIDLDGVFFIEDEVLICDIETVHSRTDAAPPPEGGGR